MCCLYDQCAHRGEYRSCLNTVSAKIMEKITVVVVYVINVPTMEESSSYTAKAKSIEKILVLFI